MGWFYGFKLHAIISHKRRQHPLKSAGGLSDRVPIKDGNVCVKCLVIGYISKAAQRGSSVVVP